MRKKVKIFALQSRIVVGGPSLSSILLAKHFHNNYYETILVGGASKTSEKSLVEVARQSNINCLIIPEMAREINFYYDIISFFKLFKLIKKEKPQIFHSHTSKAGAIGRLSAYVAGVPFIFHTFHGHIFEGYFNKIKTLIFIWMERLLARFCQKIIVISEQQRNDIVYRYKIAANSKVKVIPTALDWKSFFKDQSNIDLRKLYHISKDKFLIGIIGRIVPIKDHFFFIDIAEQLIHVLPDRFHFCVIGDGELRADLEAEVASRKLKNCFTFTGWLQLNASVYKNLDLLVLTSRNEGTPLVIIEALAAGIPVVSTAVGGVIDIMSKYNIHHMIKNRNPEEFKNLILQIVQNYAAVPKDISLSIMNYYSDERLINETKQLYESYLFGAKEN